MADRNHAHERDHSPHHDHSPLPQALDIGAFDEDLSESNARFFNR